MLTRRGRVCGGRHSAEWILGKVYSEAVLGRVLGRSWEVLGGVWEVLGEFWGGLGRRLGGLGEVLGWS